MRRPLAPHSSLSIYLYLSYNHILEFIWCNKLFKDTVHQSICLSSSFVVRSVRKPDTLYSILLKDPLKHIQFWKLYIYILYSTLFILIELIIYCSLFTFKFSLRNLRELSWRSQQFLWMKTGLTYSEFLHYGPNHRLTLLSFETHEWDSFSWP